MNSLLAYCSKQFLLRFNTTDWVNVNGITEGLYLAGIEFLFPGNEGESKK